MTETVLNRPSNLSHVAIGVSDMDASLRFYRDTIGLDVTRDDIEDFRDMDIPTYRRGVYLRWKEGDGESFLVLDQTLGEPGDRGEAKQLFTIGLHHFGFWVDDARAILERARAAGYEVLVEPLMCDSKDYGDPPGRPVITVLLRDPDGNVVQLDQRMG